MDKFHDFQNLFHRFPVYSRQVAIFALFLVCILSQISTSFAAYECKQKLYEAKGEPAQGSNGFTIELMPGTNESGSPTQQAPGYVPGKTYRITLRGWRTQYFVQTFRGFGITATFESNPSKAAGKFDIKRVWLRNGLKVKLITCFQNKKERGEARVAPNCRSAGVSHTNLRPKTEVHVIWRAPETSTECVVFRGTVIQSRHIWYMNENELTKKFCIVDGYQKVLPKDDPTAECCACDEANYDVEFIGIWSKETHPKDYPTLEHLTHFTDMLGASHSKNYSLWKMGDIATDGLKEIAEWGDFNPRLSEIQGDRNSNHNQAQRPVVPGSPRPNSGQISREQSPNNPAEPRIPIVPITTKGDKRSPFYDENADEIPPLARLIFKRKEVISSPCKVEEEYKREAFNATNTSEDEEYKDRRECSVRQWQSWSLCSATCGKGIRIRSRVYEFPVKAQMFNCHRQMTERQFCNAKINECEDSDAFNSRCTASGWSSWSECSVTCGTGVRTRERSLQDPKQAESCVVDLKARESCIGENGDDCLVTPNPLCKTTSWSDWSPCSASCDDGVRVRTRLFFYAEHEHECTNVNLMEKDTCNVHSCKRLFSAHSEEICLEEKEAGQCGGTFPRYWFNSVTKRCERFIYTGCKGNRNQFDTEEECKSFCIPEHRHNAAIIPNHQVFSDYGEEANDGGDPKPCDISEWSSWATCSVTCGKGKRQRNRAIQALARNGGSACPSSEQLIQVRNCELRPCALSSCRAGRWSAWSSCSVKCGDGYQTRRRRVNRYSADIDPDDPNCNASELEQRACRMPCS
ncbi:thrombospondin type 1 domain-containing protein [Ditylenchus destructor]|nr:thrombospondin type 1 domain-containing protein [Ditylenchus destructor]